MLRFDPSVDQSLRPGHQVVGPNQSVKIHELRTKVRLGGTYKGVLRVLRRTFKEYAIALLQGLHSLVGHIKVGGDIRC